jgi:hypothetical protein
MATAKDILVKPITSSSANEVVKRIHYSGKVVQNSQLHFGVFLNGRLEGAMQFGPSLDKRKIIGLVEGTSWNGFLELNRMAFSDALPRNSESRAMAVAFRLIKKAYPHIDWIISFSDATQCGDGTIYRAAGFVLTGIQKNKTIMQFPNGERISDVGLKFSKDAQVRLLGKAYLGTECLRKAKTLGAVPMDGSQMRYLYFLNSEARKNLTVPVIPFSRIGEMNASMYLGEKITRVKQAMTGDQPEQRRCNTDLPAPSFEAM